MLTFSFGYGPIFNKYRMSILPLKETTFLSGYIFHLALKRVIFNTLSFHYSEGRHKHICSLAATDERVGIFE